MNKKSALLLLGAASFITIVSFSPYYGVAYLLSITLLAISLPRLQIFPTLISKFILSTLMLLAVAMIVGLLGWFAKIDLLPPLVAITTTLIAVACFKSRDTAIVLGDKSDVLSVLLALATPAAIFASFFVPNYSNAALYQLISNGWDNAAHILMVETASIEKTYVYGHLKDVESKTIIDSNAYPQAWHLATANFAQGFNSNPFDPSRPFTVLQAYALAMVAWFFMASYLLSRASWSLIDKIKKNKRAMTWVGVVVFILSNLLIQLLTVTGAIQFGFANYVGLMAFMIAFIALLLEQRNAQNHRALSIVLPTLCVAGVLCWFLPLPALVGALALYFLLVHKDKTKWLPYIKQNKLALVLSILLGIVALAQVFIFASFSNITGGDLLTEAGGVSKNSEILISIIILGTAGFLIKASLSDLLKKYLVIVAPFLVLAGGLYVYQITLSDDVTYYYYKIMALVALAAGLFFIPVSVAIVDRISEKVKSPLVLAIASVCVFALLLVGTQQTLRAYFLIPQRNSKVHFDTAKAIANHLERDNLEKTKLIVLTDRTSDKGSTKNESFNGDLLMKVPHIPFTCVYYVVNLKDVDQKLPSRVKRLDKCAAELDKDKEILVIANKKSKDKILQLKRDNIRVIVVD
jgi:hypothetical protein